MDANHKIALCVAALGIVFLALGGIITLTTVIRPRTFTRAQGRIIALGSVAARNRVEPIVEFEIDGKRVQGRCNDVNLNTFQGKIGDQVDISYSVRNVMGLRTLKVYLDPDGQAGRRDQHMVIIGGMVFMIAGIALLILGKRIGS